MRTFTVAFLLGFLCVPAFACEELVSLDRSQTVDLVNTLRNNDADPLDQLFAFETLMCSDQPGVRDLSLRAAASSNNSSIKSQVLLRAMLEKEIVGVELIEVEGLSKTQYERIAKDPFKMLRVSFRDMSTACMSMHRDDHCPPYSAITMQGTTITINAEFNSDRWSGQFKMNGEVAEGFFTIGDETYPARIALF